MKPPADILLVNRDGSAHGYAPQDLLPTDRVRYVGQQVAMVVAETVAQAKDAAERIAVEYEPLDPVIAGAAAVQTGAVRLYDQVGQRLRRCRRRQSSRRRKAAFDRASRVRANPDHRAARHRRAARPARRGRRLRSRRRRNTRCMPAPAAWCGRRRSLPASSACRPTDVRVECGDVGGNYGTRNAFYPEFALVVWAAKRLGRPVKWTCERSEAFASDYQGRDQAITLELALDDNGKFLAVRGEVICNVGAHSVMYVPLVKCSELLTSVYRVPAAHIRARAALTNTVPTSPYRSAGRPEAMFAIERLIDIAARQFGYDRIDLRRRNLIPPSAQPYPNPLGMTYDSGDYAKVMDRALELVRLEGLQQAQARVASATASCAASGSPTTSRSPAARRANTPRSTCCPRAASTSRSARCRAARATRRASRNASANGSASTSTASGSSRATPTSCRSAAARTRRARCAWAAW